MALLITKFEYNIEEKLYKCKYDNIIFQSRYVHILKQEINLHIRYKKYLKILHKKYLKALNQKATVARYILSINN